MVVDKSSAGGHPALPERYDLCEEGYALYVEGLRLFVTPTVALLVDTRNDVLVTHGVPSIVRAELDALRAVGAHEPPRDVSECVLVEGAPPVDLLNRALGSREALLEILRDLGRQNPPEAARIMREAIGRAAGAAARRRRRSDNP